MSSQTQSGVTLLELVIATAVIALVFVVLVTPTSHKCGRAPFTACGSNLKQVSLALIVWANDQEVGQFPVRLPVAQHGLLGHPQAGDLTVQFAHLSNELVNPAVLACPSDREVRRAENFTDRDQGGLLHSQFRNQAISYALNTDVGVTSDKVLTQLELMPNHVVATDRNLSPAGASICSSGLTNVLDAATPGKTPVGFSVRKRYGHGLVGNVAFVDGSVAKLGNRDIGPALRQSDDRGRVHFLYPRRPDFETAINADGRRYLGND